MGHRLWPRVGLLCVCGLLPHVVVAQRYSFKYYSQEQGLEDLTVSCLFQDRTGFLWLGTMNGLFRYDGEHFQSMGGLPSTQNHCRDGDAQRITFGGYARRLGDS